MTLSRLSRAHLALATLLVASHLVLACSDDAKSSLERSWPDSGDAGIDDESGDAGPDADTDQPGPDGIDDPDADAPDDVASDPPVEDDAARDPDADPSDLATDSTETDGEPADDADAGTDATDAADQDPDPTFAVRFVTFGDWGGLPSRIHRAADAMWAQCQVAGCDFVIGLGDNFYETGVSSVDDPQWQTKFQEPFAEWDIPFYMTLGNHDYLGNPEAQVAYTLLDDLWTMPDRTYDLVASPVHFFATDTNRPTAPQAQWLYESIRDSDSPWRVAFGHHPMRSNGVHGDADASLRVFQEWAYCNQLDLLLAGHDHDLQHLLPECGVDLVISGAVERTRSTDTADNTLFAYGDDYGFAWIGMSETALRLEFFDLDGALLYRYDRTREDPTVDCSADDYCEPACPSDPDCDGLDCSADGACDDRCVDDVDCYDNCPCDFYVGICEPIANPSTVRCACDPQCRGDGRPCQPDDHCDTWCPPDTDSDCP